MYFRLQGQKGNVFARVLCGVIFVVSLMLATPEAVFSAAALGATAAPDHLTLTWANDPGTTQTITWRTDPGTTEGQVQYIEQTKALTWPRIVQTCSAGMDSLTTNLGTMNIHSVTLTGLKPDTRYLFRVGSDNGWSETHSFTTAPVDVRRFKFLVFGDAQSVNYDVWRTTLHEAYRANRDAAFIANVGDLVDVGQDYSQWNAWFDAAEGVIDGIPEMPVTGNHEYYGPERRRSMPVFFTAQFKLPGNGPDGLKGQVYSFDYGDVHFSMLDSQVYEGEQYVPGMLDRQKEWLQKDLEKTNKKWKIVFFHRSPYNNKIGRSDDAVRAAFVPVLDKYHVQVVFTAHDHVYARTYPIQNGIVGRSSAQGTVYVATGRSGSKTYADTEAKNWDEFFYSPADEPNYITVEVADNSLTIKAFKQSGGLIDAWRINAAGENNEAKGWYGSPAALAI